MVEIKSLVDVIIITLVIKLITTQWTPPLQRSLCAIISIALGTLLGVLIDLSVEGLLAGIIGSGFAFYGGELIQAFKSVTDDAKELKK